MTEGIVSYRIVGTARSHFTTRGRCFRILHDMVWLGGSIFVGTMTCGDLHVLHWGRGVHIDAEVKTLYITMGRVV